MGTTAATVDIGTLITRRPGVYGGRPCLAGTRFPVMQVAVMHNEGVSPEEIMRRFAGLELSWIYAGVAYYLANKAEVDAELAEEERIYQEGLAAQGVRYGQ
ncbi:MAG: DUF433 domain-containing protein [Dehalococcoidia bacterium]